MIDVLLADSHNLFRAAFSSILETEGCQTLSVVGEAHTARQAIQRAREQLPDLIIMDDYFPDMSGLEVAKRLILSVPTMKILILTTSSNVLYPRRFLDSGVLGYLTKTEPVEKIMGAIHLVASGRPYLSAKIAATIIDCCTVNHDILRRFNALSDRQLDIMVAMANGKNSAQISEMLCFTLETVHVYRHKIMKKLKLTRLVDLVYLAKYCGVINQFNEGRGNES